MTLLEHLRLGGVIRYNKNEKTIQLVRNSMAIIGIPCTEDDINDLIGDDLATFRTEGKELVLSAADVQVAITQRDREVFRTLVEQWGENDCLLPGGMSYQDVFDLCDKFAVPQPKEATDFLNWAEAQRAT